MRFNELREDFNTRPLKHTTPIDKVFFTAVLWENGDNSSNDLLCRYLIQNKIDYIHDCNGTVWFLYNGDWTRCKVRAERQADGTPTIAIFIRCIFE